MTRIMNMVAVAILMTLSNAQAQDSLNVKDIGNGWKALTRQADPFDKSKIQIVQINKNQFTFRCNEINMDIGTGRFDGFSLSADIKYMIDDMGAVDKQGWFSSYLGGSDMITRSMYYYAYLSDTEIESLRNGRLLKMAGKFGSTGWTTAELRLDGFSSAYDAMCKK